MSESAQSWSNGMPGDIEKAVDAGSEPSSKGKNSGDQHSERERSSGDRGPLGPTSVGPGHERGSDPDRPKDTAHTLFEFDRERSALIWSDGGATAAWLGLDNADITQISDYDDRILGEAPEARNKVFRGEAKSYSCEYLLARPEGEPVWYEERGGWINYAGASRLIGVLRNIDEEKRATQELSRRAERDDLTGLLNRAQIRMRLSEMLRDCNDNNKKAAYLLAGIDDVGAINADFGFEAADVVIQEVARRLSTEMGHAAAIGRVAGTKFGIVVETQGEEPLRNICIRLLNVIRASVIETTKGAVASSVCLGAIELPADGVDANGAMARAEAALDQAKRIGPSSWARYSEKTDVVSMRRRNTHMSDVILTALNERRVRLAFQPIIADLGEAPTKFECLIRMRGDDGGEVPAPEFIPVAERLGLVHLLDRRVLELAINTLAHVPNVNLNVNISMETVKDPVWAEGYLSLMRANAAIARRITVELTETKVIDAVDASIEFVSEIKALGASFAIDDFGAGYTSFRNLKALDIDILKIDGSFVTGVSASRENQLFVRTLLDLARNFGMKTVAEWVDNEADAMLLKGLGVDYLQGFLLGRPETNPAWLPEGAPNDRPSQVSPL